MADVGSITAVRTGSTTVISNVTYGATIAVGDILYLDSTDNEYKLADCDASATTAAARGVALTPGVDGGNGVIATSGPVTFVGATLTVGDSYVVSGNPGKFCPETDLASNDYVTDLGRASSTTVLQLSINRTGIQVP